MAEATSEALVDAHGPVDFLLIEFPADRLTGAVAPELIALVESGTIRLYDLMVISDEGWKKLILAQHRWISYTPSVLIIKD